MSIPSSKWPHQLPSFLDYSLLGIDTKTHFLTFYKNVSKTFEDI